MYDGVGSSKQHLSLVQHVVVGVSLGKERHGDGYGGRVPLGMTLMAA